MNRRDFTKALASLGLSTAGIQHMTQESLANLTKDPKNEIPRFKGFRHKYPKKWERGENQEREPMYYTIPRWMWIDVEATSDATDRVAQQFNDPLLSFGIRRDPGSHTGLSVSATWKKIKYEDGSEEKPSISYDEFEQRVPSTQDGVAGSGENSELVKDIPVIIKKATDHNHAYYDCKYRPVLGGCQWEKQEWGYYCTIGARAWDYERSEYVLTTAAHCSDRQSGYTVYQATVADGKIGEAGRYISDGHGDAQVVALKDSVDANNYIASNDCSKDWAIGGMISETRLKDMMKNDDYLYAQGRTSGRWTSVILEVKDSKDPRKVIIDADLKGGDSGGPYFEVADHDNDGYEEAWIAAIHKGGRDHDDDGDEDSGGTTAESVEDYLNIAF